MTVTTDQTAAPTVQQIQTDRITQVWFKEMVNSTNSLQWLFQLAEKYWAPHSVEKHLDFDPDVIEDIYMKDIRGSK